MSKTKHVLIAEDDPLLSGLLKDEFLQRGVRVTLVGDGKAALDLLNEDIDLALVDLLMPVMDGFTLLEHAVKKCPTLPVIVLTNLGDKTSRERCSQLGCQGFLVKSDLDESEVWTIASKYLT